MPDKMQLIIKALEIISATANQAFWMDQSAHCGSDFNSFTCEPCWAYGQCKRNEQLIALFIELNKEGG